MEMVLQRRRAEPVGKQKENALNPDSLEEDRGVSVVNQNWALGS